MNLEDASCPCCTSNQFQLEVAAKDFVYGNVGEWRYVRCDECGIVYMNPRIPPQEIGRYYPTSYYTYNIDCGPSSALTTKSITRTTLKRWVLQAEFGYRDMDAEKLSLCKAVIAKLLGKLPFSRRQIHWVRGGSVLDVGCGNGAMLDHYRMLGWKTFGVEPDAKAASIATSKGHCVYKSIPKPEEFIGKVDAITFWDSLEHIADPRSVMAWCKTCLRKGGRVYIHVPNYNSLWRVIWSDKWLMFTAPVHYVQYDRYTLGRIVSDAGFEVQDISVGLGENGLWHSLRNSLHSRKLLLRFVNTNFVRRCMESLDKVLPGGHIRCVALSP